MLPHLGSATDETRVDMGMRAMENLNAIMSGKAPRDHVT
jgi:lactate dehydrogenase-like 2-hydroxyacid dehydrogenase